jgi:hypothetical protein
VARRFDVTRQQVYDWRARRSALIGCSGTWISTIERQALAVMHVNLWPAEGDPAKGGDADAK